MLNSFTICVTVSPSTLSCTLAATPAFTWKVRLTTSTLDPVTSEEAVLLFMPLVDMDTVPALVVTTAEMYLDEVEVL